MKTYQNMYSTFPTKNKIKMNWNREKGEKKKKGKGFYQNNQKSFKSISEPKNDYQTGTLLHFNA